jgi:hypothetical protein
MLLHAASRRAKNGPFAQQCSDAFHRCRQGETSRHAPEGGTTSVGEPPNCHDSALHPSMAGACFGVLLPAFAKRYRLNIGLVACLRRLWVLRKGRFRHWSEHNVAALMRVRPRVNAENRQIFDLFARRAIGRCCGARKCSPKLACTGRPRGNLGLAAAVALNEI